MSNNNKNINAINVNTRNFNYHTLSRDGIRGGMEWVTMPERAWGWLGNNRIVDEFGGGFNIKGSRYGTLYVEPPLGGKDGSGNFLVFVDNSGLGHTIAGGGGGGIGYWTPAAPTSGAIGGATGGNNHIRPKADVSSVIIYDDKIASINLILQNQSSSVWTHLRYTDSSNQDVSLDNAALIVMDKMQFLEASGNVSAVGSPAGLGTIRYTYENPEGGLDPSGSSFQGLVYGPNDSSHWVKFGEGQHTAITYWKNELLPSSHYKVTTTGLSIPGITLELQGADASANYSVAIGLNSRTRPDASGSVAIGIRNTTSAPGAVALGYDCSAGGICSFADGSGCIAAGNYAVAMGLDCSASGQAAVAMGDSNHASGNYAVAMGNSNTASDFSVAMGSGNTAVPWAPGAPGAAAVAMGDGNTASGNYAVAMGLNNTASGNNAVAMGNTNTVNNSNSVAMGSGNTASGGYAVAMGYKNKASGDYSVAMGDSNAASACSVAMGCNNDASGNGSVAMGIWAHTYNNHSANPLHSADFIYTPNGVDGTWLAPFGGSHDNYGCPANNSHGFFQRGNGDFVIWGGDPPVTIEISPTNSHGAAIERFATSSTKTFDNTFIIPHPEHEGKMLRHACIEAPTRGTNIYEYQLEATEPNQTTKITLPSYFKHINGRPRVYVTPKNVLSTCCGDVDEELIHAIILTEKPGIFNVMVTGVRKDPGAVKYAPSIYIDEPISPEDIPPTQTVVGCGSNYNKE